MNLRINMILTVGDWVKFDTDTLKDESLFPQGLSEWQKREFVENSVLHGNIKDYRLEYVWLVKEINGNDFVIEDMIDNKTYVADFRFPLFFKKYWPCDMRGNLLNIGDRCVFADSEKRIIIGTITKFGKFHNNYHGCEIALTFKDLEGVEEIKYGPRQNHRIQTDPRGRLKIS